jgi:nicotinamidase-related amidase
MIKKLLIIIDAQYEFVNKQNDDFPKKVAEYLANHEKEYHKVLFTKFINKSGSAYENKLNYKSNKVKSEIINELNKYITDTNVFKKDTYSVFKNRKLLEFIKSNDYSVIYIAGLTTDGCVLASAFEGFDLGFDIRIVQEITSTCWGDKKFNDLMLQLIGYKIDPTILEGGKHE